MVNGGVSSAVASPISRLFRPDSNLRIVDVMIGFWFFLFFVGVVFGEEVGIVGVAALFLRFVAGGFGVGLLFEVIQTHRNIPSSTSTFRNVRRILTGRCGRCDLYCLPTAAMSPGATQRHIAAYGAKGLRLEGVEKLLVAEHEAIEQMVAGLSERVEARAVLGFHVPRSQLVCCRH